MPHIYNYPSWVGNPGWTKLLHQVQLGNQWIFFFKKSFSWNITTLLSSISFLHSPPLASLPKGILCPWIGRIAIIKWLSYQNQFTSQIQWNSNQNYNLPETKSIVQFIGNQKRPQLAKAFGAKGGLQEVLLFQTKHIS